MELIRSDFFVFLHKPTIFNTNKWSFCIEEAVHWDFHILKIIGLILCKYDWVFDLKSEN